VDLKKDGTVSEVKETALKALGLERKDYTFASAAYTVDVTDWSSKKDNDHHDLKHLYTLVVTAPSHLIPKRQRKRVQEPEVVSGKDDDEFKGFTASNVFKKLASKGKEHKIALKFIDQNTPEVMDQKAWLGLSKDELIEIISRDSLGAESELQVFQSVHRWGTAQATKSGKELSEELKDVLVHVRFPLMTTEDVAAKVVPTKLLSSTQTLELFTYLAQKSAGIKATIKGWNLKEREGSNRIFKYVSNFDSNGILYWLGTQEGKNKNWANPLQLGVIEVSTSASSGWYLLPSSGTGDRTDFNVMFERPSPSTWCSSTSDRAVVVDLVKYQVQPTHITLACNYSPNSYLCNFSVSGSNDKTQWDVLFTESTPKVSQGVPYTWPIDKDKKKELSLL